MIRPRLNCWHNPVKQCWNGKKLIYIFILFTILWTTWHSGTPDTCQHLTNLFHQRKERFPAWWLAFEGRLHHRAQTHFGCTETTLSLPQSTLELPMQPHQISCLRIPGLSIEAGQAHLPQANCRKQSSANRCSLETSKGLTANHGFGSKSTKTQLFNLMGSPSSERTPQRRAVASPPSPYFQESGRRAGW